MLSGISWNKQDKKYCMESKSYSTKYENMESAKKACLAMTDDCLGVYDQQCDDKPKYRLCKPATLSDSGQTSCVYELGMHLCMVCMHACMVMHICVNMRMHFRCMH